MGIKPLEKPKIPIKPNTVDSCLLHIRVISIMIVICKLIFKPRRNVTDTRKKSLSFQPPVNTIQGLYKIIN